MSVLIRDRERVRDERDWDDRSSSQRDNARGTYTTVRQYRIPREEETKTSHTEKLTVYNNDVDRRSTISSASRGSRDARGYDETRIIRRERTPEPEPERRTERDIRIERIVREREPEPERRYERDVRIERFEREPEPRRFEREYRYEHDIDRLPVRRQPYELERYSKSTEYFRPEPPPPIIIRQEPQQIIIQEAPRAPIIIPAPKKEESDYQVIQRSEVTEDRQVARREPEREDYYYERRTREVSGGDREEDFVEDRYKRRGRDVSPGDSASQHGRDYSSDESVVYVKETRETYGRDVSPHHKRHLAEGALVGLGAAEILRHHHEKEKKETSGTGGRIGKDVGAAALGAVAAAGITRARSHRREKSKSRRGSRSRSWSRERDREGRRKHRHRERSRSRSKSRVRQLAGVGLGAVALAAAVGYANRNKNNEKDKDKSDRRSRSRTRRHSASEAPDDARNPSHRNKKIAQATLAGAAVAGLVERARSRSRGGRGKSRSKSRVRTGLPIAAAGLGSAALAGLYEQRQAKKAEKAEKEDKVVARDERARRRESSSRSRSRSDPRLIEYGDEPVYSGGRADYQQRPASQSGYYGPPDGALVPPAAAGAAAGAVYGAARDEDRPREQSFSDSESERRRRRRHRRRKSNREESGSRNRAGELAAAGLAAGAATLAATEHEKRKQRRKEEKRERRRQEAEQQRAYEDVQAGHVPSAPYGAPQPGPSPVGYPPDNYYPPPNTGPLPPNPGFGASPVYNPANYPAPVGAQPAPQIHPDYGYPPQQAFPPPPAGPYTPAQVDPYGPPGNVARRGDENVSGKLFSNNTSGTPAVPEYQVEEGLSRKFMPPAVPLDKPRSRASSQPPPRRKSVHFDPVSYFDRPDRTNAGGSNSPDNQSDEGPSLSFNDDDEQHASHLKNDHPSGHHDDDDYHHRRRVSHNDFERSPSPAPSDTTLDLPPRFDQYGRRRPEKGEDPLADALEDVLSGSDPAGKLFNKFTGALGLSHDKGGSRSRRR